MTHDIPMNTMDVKGVKVTVLGFGKSGLAAAELLCGRGAEVAVTDCLEEENLHGRVAKLRNRKVKFFLGSDGAGAVEGADVLVVSPGVPADAPPLRLAEKKKIRIISEVELFSWFCRSPVIAITGTNGKTTTADLVAKLLGNAGYRVKLAGNIGIPLTGIVKELEAGEKVVAEISSFQLEHIEKFHPHISVLLNVTPDHLDRYGSFREYVSAKGRIFENQDKSDFAVINADDSEASGFLGRVESAAVPYSRKKDLKEGVFVNSGRIMSRWEGKEKYICSVGDIRMKGLHNIENCLAAVAVGLICGADTVSMRNTISEFPGLEHRLEHVGTVNGVGFFNDSKATNVGAVMKALGSFDCPVILICGGRDKGSDYTVLRNSVKGKVKLAVLIGEASKKLLDALGGVVHCEESESFHSAFLSAVSSALPGDVVLLSPACSSFDMFKDFEERGRIFKAEVENFSKGYNY